MPNDRPPLPGLIGVPLSSMYSVAVRARNRRFDQGKGVYKSSIPVISVGNISVGGVGKTPMVQRIARTLLAHGHRPAIVLRGYKAGAGQMSDEEAEHRGALPDAIVIANPDRVAAAGALEMRDEATRPTCIILDDGFQHRRLGRALDLVLIDARRSPWDDAVLPAGWLREPPSSLSRADAVVLTHADLAQPVDLANLCSRIERTHGKPPIATMRHAWSGMLVESERGNGMSRETNDWLRGRRVAVCCAIGEPDQFLAMIETHGALIASRLVLRDHAQFDRAAIERIATGLDASSGDAIVCTAKDWPRLAPALPEGFAGSIAYPVVSMEAMSGGDEVDALVLRSAGTPPTQE